MLKLNASYSKKVPAEGEYSSQSYHASIEVELPDGLTQEQLQNRIHETFALVKDSVETELHGRPARQLQSLLHSLSVVLQTTTPRKMLLQVRNRSSTCLIWGAILAGLRSRSLQGAM